MAIHRNRVIYQSEALFTCPDATGYHFTGAAGNIPNIGTVSAGLMTPPTGTTQAFGGTLGTPAKNNAGQLVGWRCGDPWPEWNADGSNATYAKAHGTIIKQLKRVQTANYGFTVNRQDVNQFGNLSRLDAIVVDSPTVNLDFSYYIIDGYNERMLEFVTDGKTNTLSGAMAPELYQAGNNFYILTVPEARDAVLGDINIGAQGDENLKTVISLGNGYVTDYSVDISVGSIPTASLTVEGMNIRSDFGETGNDIPGIDMANGSLKSDAWGAGRGVCNGAAGCTGLYSLPAATSGYSGCATSDISALRPGDVVLNLKNAALISKQVSGGGTDPLVGSAHVQSVSLNLPMGRTTLQRLGSTFGFSKALDLPITATMSVSAMVSDLKEGNLTDLLCSCDSYDLEVTLHDPECSDCNSKDNPVAMRYILKGAKLDSENFSSTIGDNKSVDLTFSTQVGGADDPTYGVYISGKEASNKTSAPNGGLPPSWTGLNGAVNAPVSGFVAGYRV